MARVTLVRGLFALGPLLGCVGCPGQRSEAPPRAEPLEVVSAAPGALGALAAGTDAAPPVVQPSPEEALSGEETAPHADAGLPEIPEAGAAAPENVPL